MPHNSLIRPVRPFDELTAAIDDFVGAKAAEGRSSKTIERYHTALGHLETFLRGDGRAVAPAAIDARVLRRWVQWLKARGITNTTQAG